MCRFRVFLPLFDVCMGSGGLESASFSGLASASQPEPFWLPGMLEHCFVVASFLLCRDVVVL